MGITAKCNVVSDNSNTDSLVCLKDFEEAALKKLERRTAEYYRGGADDEVTAEDNKDAFQSWKIRPRVMIDVSARNLTTTVLGKPVAFPIGISPTAYQRVANENGETATARAAEKLGTILTFSLFATSSYEEIAQVAPNGRKWFQMFIFKSRSFMSKIIERAELAGFEALVITLDGQYFGTRRACLRQPFEFPTHLRLYNVDGDKGDLTYAKIIGLHEYMNPGPTWDDIKWLKSATKLPVVVKGVMTGEDAQIAVDCGVDAVWVSNHGGRQLDTVMATIDVLPEIVAQVGGKCDVYLDGGVCRGTDVFKALALGANMVFMGRSVIWGLIMNGQEGVEKVLEILKQELDLAMALSGTPTIADIKREFVIRQPPMLPTNASVTTNVVMKDNNKWTDRYIEAKAA